MTYRSSEDFSQETSAFRRFVYGMIRRFAITLTDSARWQLLGQNGGAGGAEILSDVESFTGIGFYSRPPSSGGNPEAIGVAVGGTRTTVIIAARDEATRQAVVSDLPADSAAMFNTKAVFVINPNGTVEVRLAGGGKAAPLATLADLQSLASFVQRMTLPVSGVTAGPPPPGSVPTPAGTTVLNAQ